MPAMSVTGPIPPKTFPLKRLTDELAKSPDERVQKWVREQSRNGGWRALFDPVASEWENTTTTEKLETLYAFFEAGFNLHQLVVAFKLHYEECGRSDISIAADMALCHYLEYTMNM